LQIEVQWDISNDWGVLNFSARLTLAVIVWMVQQYLGMMQQSSWHMSQGLDELDHSNVGSATGAIRARQQHPHHSGTQQCQRQMKTAKNRGKVGVERMKTMAEVCSTMQLTINRSSGLIHYQLTINRSSGLF
jgi:hypothetical protein